MRISVKKPSEGLINRWASMWHAGFLVSFTLARDKQGEWMTVIPHPGLWTTAAPPIYRVWIEELKKMPGAVVDASS
jgi:hypothetical protein